MKKRLAAVIAVGMLAVLLLGGCSQTGQPEQEERGVLTSHDAEPEMAGSEENTEAAQAESMTEETTEDTVSEAGPATLLYQGQASIRIVTDEGRVIYIDLYAGEGYDLPADLILVTHAHFDHGQIDKVENRAQDCRIITQEEALQNGEHQVFELEYVTVEAVEAGYNSWHDVRECVGYILTFSNGKSVYVTGDTSTTEQMPLLKEKEIDYAFYCCDGVYNMGLAEAAECAEAVGAKHNIPYHVSADGRFYDRALAEQFEAENCMIVEDGGEILIE